MGCGRIPVGAAASDRKPPDRDGRRDPWPLRYVDGVGIVTVCAACNATNEAGRKFCGSCGARLARTCPTCGTPNPADVRFCGECGGRLDAAPASPTTQQPTPGPSSPPIAERRLVSVLFADLVGFTSLAEGRDPEAVRELLTHHFERAQEIIARYGGTVEKFIGDAVMAVWGVPVTREDDAERAVRAALDLLDGVHAVEPGLAARAAVVTGEAAVTLGATGQGMVAGDLVNTASRLQSVAPTSGVLVGEATMQATSGAIVYEVAGEHQLKGKVAPVPAWRALRVVAEVGGRNRQDVLEAPFVGRDADLRLLRDLLAATGRERRVRLVSVTGQAGIGKSRLGWELSKWADGIIEAVWWHAGRSPAYGEGVTFWALAEMVRARCGIVDSGDAAAVRERVGEAVRRWATDPEDARRIEPALRTLLGIEGYAMAREELFAAWRRFFELIAVEGTVVLLFEDLQWADPGLLDFIDHLLHWSAGAPIMVLTMARPELLERRPDWGVGQRSFVAMHLEPLPDAAMHELLTGLAPGLPDEAVTRIVARADGVPLYAVELVRMLVNEGRLVATPDGFRAAGDLGELAIPPTLQGLIGARLDALDAQDRRLVQDAAVLGQTFSLTALVAVAGVDEDVVAPRIRGLVQRELLMEDVDPRSPDRGQYGFVQALIREVAYGTIALADRRARHLAAARYFESLGDDSIAGALAAHYLAAHASSSPGPERDALAVQARIALRGAADRAATLGVHDQAVVFLEQAISVTTDDVERAPLLLTAGDEASKAGQIADAKRLLLDARSAYRSMGDAGGAMAARGALAATCNLGREYEAALEILGDIDQEVDATTNDPRLVRTAAQLPRALMLLRRDRARGLAAADKVMTAAERLGLDDVVADTLITKGVLVDLEGRRREGIALLRAGIDLAWRTGAPVTGLRGSINLGHALEPLELLEASRSAFLEASRLGLPHQATMLLGNAVAAASETGDWDWAAGAIRDALPSAAERMTLLNGLVWVEGLHGLPIGTHAAEIRAWYAGRDLSMAVTDLADLRLVEALSAGRMADAYQVGLEFEVGGLAVPGYGLVWAARAGAIAGDRAQVERLLPLFEPFGPGDRERLAARREVEATLAALDGDVAGSLAGWRQARRLLQELGCRPALGLCGIAMGARLSHSEPDVRAALDEARSILVELGARPWLALLDTVDERDDAGVERDPADRRAPAESREPVA